jgi:hypothetical protein
VTRAETWLLHASNLAVGGTGLVYAWMRYLARPADEFAVVNHPWQPAVQHLHVLVAPLLVFALGLVWTEHVWRRVRTGFRARRRTGLALLGLFAPMALSGYLLQISVEEGWRTAWIWIHVATSLLWIGSYLVHQLSKRPVSAAPARAPAPRAAPAPDPAGGLPPRA